MKGPAAHQILFVRGTGVNGALLDLRALLDLGYRLLSDQHSLAHVIVIGVATRQQTCKCA